jgi:hypothetical protein
LKSALSVERLFLNPNCSLARMLFEFKKSLTLLYITFSNILENAVSNEFALQLDMHDFSPFLKRGLNFEYLSHIALIM